MALPALAKSWQISPNRTIVAQGSTYKTRCMVAKNIKDALIGFGSNAWTVRYSCNARIDQPGSVNAGAAGAAGDGVDRWGALSDFVGSGGGGDASAARFPWFVLRQVGIAANAEICIDMGTGSGSSVINVTISPTAGFTGGAVNARPTATDERTLITQAVSNTDVQHIVHASQSTDGQVTRIFAFKGGDTNLFAFGAEVPQNVVTGWASPSVWWGRGAASAGVSNAAAQYAFLTGANAVSKNGATNFAVNLACYGIGGVIDCNLTDIGSVVNSFSSEWPFFPIGVQSTTTSAKGFHGNLFDMWWRPNGTNWADTFPNDPNNRQFVVFGDLIVPWTGAADVPLLV